MGKLIFNHAEFGRPDREIADRERRKRAAINAVADAEIKMINASKDAFMSELKREHEETMQAMKREHEEKMQTLDSYEARINEAKERGDFDEVIRLLTEAGNVIS